MVLRRNTECSWGQTSESLRWLKEIFLVLFKLAGWELLRPPGFKKGILCCVQPPCSWYFWATICIYHSIMYDYMYNYEYVLYTYSLAQSLSHVDQLSPFWTILASGLSPKPRCNTVVEISSYFSSIKLPARSHGSFHVLGGYNLLVTRFQNQMKELTHFSSWNVYFCLKEHTNSVVSRCGGEEHHWNALGQWVDFGALGWLLIW